MFGFMKKAQSATLPTFTAAQLRPRIKHVNYIKALRDAGVPPEQIPMHVPLCGELLVTYAFDLPDSFIMATPTLLAQAGVRVDDAPLLARQNFGGPMSGVKFHSQDGCALAVVGDEMEASLLVLNGVWRSAQADVRGDVLVTVPRRNRLLMCDSADANAVLALREHTQTFFNELQDQHRLSTQVMVRRAEAWVLFDAN